MCFVGFWCLLVFVGFCSWLLFWVSVLGYLGVGG